MPFRASCPIARARRVQAKIKATSGEIAGRGLDKGCNRRASATGKLESLSQPKRSTPKLVSLCTVSHVASHTPPSPTASMGLLSKQEIEEARTVRPETVLDPEGESQAPDPPAKGHSPFIGFAAGLLSGWTKLVVGHPFDTIKTRLQCAPPGTYKGAWDCLVKTVTKEGARAVYKGASVPAISWGITDSILMGSLHNYRACLKGYGFSEPTPNGDGTRLTIAGHSLAGLFAGWTNAAVAHPTETIKCKLQLQLVQPDHVPKQYSGPIDVVRQTYNAQGITGMWRGLPASFIYRSCFAAMFGGFEVFNRLFNSWKGTSWEMSPGAANFFAGGMASNLYWFSALPLDNVKNRIMCDSPTNPRYKSVPDAYRQTWRETYDPKKSFGWNSIARVRNFYRGFIPVVLRAFPTNAAALAVWEATMRWATK